MADMDQLRINRTIRVEPDTYTVTLEPLTPAEYHRVMAALAPLNLGLFTTVTATVEWTPDVAAQVSDTDPAVSIAGADVPECSVCLHSPGLHAGDSCTWVGPRRESGGGGYTYDHCPCRGYTGAEAAATPTSPPPELWPIAVEPSPMCLPREMECQGCNHAEDWHTGSASAINGRGPTCRAVVATTGTPSGIRPCRCVGYAPTLFARTGKH